jgi:hypothetical protein
MVPSHGVFALGGKNRYADKRYFAAEKTNIFSPILNPISDPWWLWNPL